MLCTFSLIVHLHSNHRSFQFSAWLIAKFVSYLSLLLIFAFALYTIVSFYLLCMSCNSFESQIWCFGLQGLMQSFNVRFYVNLAKIWAVFNVCCHHCRWQKFQIFCSPCFCLPSLLWIFLNTQSVSLATFSTIIHCYYTGALLIWYLGVE